MSFRQCHLDSMRQMRKSVVTSFITIGFWESQSPPWVSEWRHRLTDALGLRGVQELCTCKLHDEG